MSLTLHFHPLSSFCQKALIGLYELEIPFTKHQVDLSKEDERAALTKLWPMCKFPVLRDEAHGVTVPETSILLEYAEAMSGKKGHLIPTDPTQALICRLRDRFFDLYVDLPMQRLVGDKLRPEGKKDPFGVEQNRAQIEKAYGVADEWLREGPWALGEAFSMADCAAAPALFYASRMVPFGDKKHLAAYFARLEERPSYARVQEEAKPYLAHFPG